GIGGNGDRFGAYSGRVAQPGDFNRLAGTSAGGHYAAGTREHAQVQAVERVAVAAVGTFANLNDIAAIVGRHDRTHGVLPQQRGVVASRQFEPLVVKNGQVGVEEGQTEPQPFEFGGNA